MSYMANKYCVVLYCKQHVHSFERKRFEVISLCVGGGLKKTICIMLLVRHNWTHPFYHLFLLLFRALNIYILKLFFVTQLIGILHVD